MPDQESALPDVAALLRPGDTVLWEGSQTFEGGLRVTSSGTTALPVTFGSFGTGRAELKVTAGDAVFAKNVAGITIQNLNLTGFHCAPSVPPAQCDRAIGNGIFFLNDLTDNSRLDSITVRDVDISGFAFERDSWQPNNGSGLTGVGLWLKGWNGTAGFKNVTFERVVAHYNMRAGIQVDSAYPRLGHENVRIIDCESFRNEGMPGLVHHSGSGIILSGTDGGTISGSFAHDNGTFNDSAGGPVGIWSYAANNILIRGNRAIRNWTRGSADGGGFDFDGGVTNSIIEYNYSEGNAGPGLLLAQFPGAPPFHHNIIRHNTSVNDSRNTGAAGVVVWGDVSDCAIHDNLVISSSSHVGFGGGGVSFYEWTGTNLSIERNKFVVHDGIMFYNYWQGPYAIMNPNARLLFDRNAYLPCDGPFLAMYNGTQYNSLEDWRRSSFNGVSYEPNGASISPTNEVQAYCTGYPAAGP